MSLALVLKEKEMHKQVKKEKQKSLKVIDKAGVFNSSPKYLLNITNNYQLSRSKQSSICATITYVHLRPFLVSNYFISAFQLEGIVIRETPAGLIMCTVQCSAVMWSFVNVKFKEMWGGWWTRNTVYCLPWCGGCIEQFSRRHQHSAPQHYGDHSTPL